MSARTDSLGRAVLLSHACSYRRSLPRISGVHAAAKTVLRRKVKGKRPAPARQKSKSEKGQAAARHPIEGFDWNRIRQGTKLILVASAALISPTGKLLLAQRVGKKFLAGSWEFPGGKVVKGETPTSALVRELKEELRIEVATEDLAPISFTTCRVKEDTAALILLFGVHKWLHEPQGAENQPVMWISPDDILKHQVTDACHNMHLAVCQAVDAHCKLETAINT